MDVMQSNRAAVFFVVLSRKKQEKEEEKNVRVAEESERSMHAYVPFFFSFLS